MKAKVLFGSYVGWMCIFFCFEFRDGNAVVESSGWTTYKSNGHLHNERDKEGMPEISTKTVNYKTKQKIIV